MLQENGGAADLTAAAVRARRTSSKKTTLADAVPEAVEAPTTATNTDESDVAIPSTAAVVTDETPEPPDRTAATTKASPTKTTTTRLRGKDLDRAKAQKRERAKAQRKQHNALVEKWMPAQRGAVIVLDVSLGSESVESWFKRTYLRHARALQRINNFPPGNDTQVTYDMITAVRTAASKAIADETRKVQAISQRLEHTVNEVCAHKAHYVNAFVPKQPIYISTKAAIELFELYKSADAAFLALKTLELNSLITEKKYGEEARQIRLSVFKACDSIYRNLTRLYIAAGRPIEHGLDADGDSDNPVTQTTDEAPASAPTTETTPTEEHRADASKRLASELALSS